jgi:hypothetical protein
MSDSIGAGDSGSRKEDYTSGPEGTGGDRNEPSKDKKQGSRLRGVARGGLGKNPEKSATKIVAKLVGRSRKKGSGLVESTEGFVKKATGQDVDMGKAASQAANSTLGQAVGDVASSTGSNIKKEAIHKAQVKAKDGSLTKGPVGSFLKGVAGKVVEYAPEVKNTTIRKQMGRSSISRGMQAPCSRQNSVVRKFGELNPYDRKLVETWKQKEIVGGKALKGNLPRLLLASFMNGDLDEANKLIEKMERTTNLGTGHELHKGDYDFTATTLVTSLKLYGRGSEGGALMSPKAEDYMLGKLLQFDVRAEEISKLAEGSFDLACPNTARRIEESENHTWMILSSIYLVNKHRSEQNIGSSKVVENAGKFVNDFEKRILKFIEYTKNAGLHEYNAIPYIAYTITPLLNLEAFASDEIRQGARDLLDHIFHSYALSSLNGKNASPFNRLASNAGETSLVKDYRGSFVNAWVEDAPLEDLGVGGITHALIGSVMPYRPSEETISLLRNKDGYLAKLGHGKEGSPEIYYGESSHLISAGGSRPRDADNDAVTRPITLIFPDTKDMSETLILGEPGKCGSINNSGVWGEPGRGFAVSRGGFYNTSDLPVVSKVAVEKGDWSLLKGVGGIYVAAYNANIEEGSSNSGGNSGVLDTLKKDAITKGKEIYASSTKQKKTHSEPEKKLGLMAVFKKRELIDGGSEAFLSRIITANSNASLLSQMFTCPEEEGGTIIRYDADASRDKWVMESIQNPGEAPVMFDRDFKDWSQMRVATSGSSSAALLEIDEHSQEEKHS